MFQRPQESLIPFSLFVNRIVRCAIFSFLLIAIIVLIGSFGFHSFEKWSWGDAILNSILIMCGCGMNKEITLPAAKIFVSFYAVVSTILYFAILIMLVYPLIHRFMHSFRLEVEDGKMDDM